MPGGTGLEVSLSQGHEVTPIYKPDYLMFGSLHLPEPRLDALFASKINPQLLAMVSMISTLPQSTSQQYGSQSSELDFEHASRSLPNLFLSLRHDNARWASEGSYSFPDHLIGFRVLHNFGVQPGGTSSSEDRDDAPSAAPLVEADAADSGTGLRGRFSAGAEVHFSASTKSGGRTHLLPNTWNLM
jgi:distribution and morphology protein 10